MCNAFLINELNRIFILFLMIFENNIRMMFRIPVIYNEICKIFSWNFLFLLNKTALHIAVEKGNIDILILLLMSEKEIEINAKLIMNKSSLISFKKYNFIKFRKNN